MQEAIGEAEDETQDEHISYYKIIRDNLGKAMGIIKWNCDKSQCELTKESIKNAVETPGSIFLLADKNYGIVLLPIEVMVKAAENMLAELEGVMI